MVTEWSPEKNGGLVMMREAAYKPLQKRVNGLSVVGVSRFERPTPCAQGRCADQTALHPDKKKAALSYSPTQLPMQYHRRCGA